MYEVISGKYTIRQILRDFWADFLMVNQGNIRQTVLDNTARVMACRDKDKLGCSVYACPVCGGQHIVVAHTCQSGFCNARGKVKNDEWIVKARDRLLNVPRKHLVFSIPREIRLIFRG